MVEYDELRLRIWPTGRGRYLVYGNGTVSAAAIVRLDLPPMKYGERYASFMEDEITSRQRSGASTPEEARQLGRELFAELFSKPLLDCLHENHKAARNLGRGVRLRFDVSPDLMPVPFETLSAPADDALGVLALNHTISIVRSLKGEPQLPLRQPTHDGKVELFRVLIVVASPKGEPKLNATAEVDAIRSSLKGVELIRGVRIECVGLPGGRSSRATRSEVERLLKSETASVVLFIAHGKYDTDLGEMTLLLEHKDGSPDPVPATALRTILGQAPGVRFVLLNLCFGSQILQGEPFSGLAQALIATGVSAVVGMQTEVTDETAARFSPKVLDSICTNETVDAAVAAGRREIVRVRPETIESANPALFLHEQCGHGFLFHVKQVDGGPDPLSEWAAALNRIESPGNPNLADFVPAVRFLSASRRWAEAAQLAEFGLRSAGPSMQLRKALEQQLAEANAELRIADIHQICDRLTAAHVLEAMLALDDIKEREPQHALLPLLEREIESARRYQQACDAAAREDWAAAAAEYTALDQDAYLPQSSDELKYARGRLAEQRGEWVTARDQFQSMGRRDPDLTARLAYAEGRIAEVDGRWDAAVIAFQQVPAGQAGDAALRLACAHARSAEVKGDLRGMLAAVESAPGDEPAVAVIRSAAYAGLSGEASRHESENHWEEAAAIYNLLPEQHSERARRKSYVAGRLAENQERWADALQAYSQIDPKDDELRHRIGYIEATIAEAKDCWDDAVRLWAGPPRDYCDVRLRVQYARGRDFETRGDWSNVINGFGALADDYRDVRLRRAFARARVAETEGRWADVLEAFSAEIAQQLGSDATSLRAYAAGRLAEERCEWQAAAEAFGGAADYDAMARRHYAEGRAAEGRDWPAARAAFTRVPDEHQDAAARRAYADGRVAMDRGDWEAAEAAFAFCSDDSTDRLDRLAYARARQAFDRGEWPEVDRLLKVIEAVAPDIQAMRHYVHGRAAERGEQWAHAARAFASSGDFRDAAERSIYARGREREAEGRWSAAVAEYARLTDPFLDVEARKERLAGWLAAVAWIDGLAVGRLVADPAATSNRRLPYSALASAGITPSSSAEVVRDASFTLMESGGMTPEERMAWDQLRVTPERLRVDAFLHRLRDPQAVHQVQQDLSATVPSDPLDELCRALPSDAPLLRLLADRRDDAIEAWEASLEGPGSTVAISHSLAIAYFWTANRLESGGAHERAEEAWQRAIAHWAVVITDDAFWSEWGRERSHAYQQAVSQGDIVRLRSDVVQRLLDVFAEREAACASEGLTRRAQRYRELALAFEAELDGARSLKEVGGLSPDGRDAGPSCGRFYVAHRLLGPRLAATLAQVHAEAADSSDESLLSIQGDGLCRLRCAFSELSRAQALLEHHLPDAAIEALPANYKKTLGELPPDCGWSQTEDVSAHIANCASCQALVRHNPAYLFLPHREARLLQDAVGLACEARLELARFALVGGSSGLAVALQQWREAIAVSRNAGSQVRVKRRVAAMALGRAEALASTQGRLRGVRLTEAIDLVNRARELVGGADEGQLIGKASELLTSRGVWFGYLCHEYEPTDYERAADDLRRALGLNPESLSARVNLTRALVFHAAGMPYGAERSLELILEALTVLLEGLRRTAGHGQVREMLLETLEELEKRILFDLSPEQLAARIAEATATSSDPGDSLPEDQLAAAGVSRLAAGDVPGALNALVGATRRDPANDRIVQHLIDAVKRRVGIGQPRMRDA